ncbi:MAG: TetR/AcrR family transcriptional regulator [Solirubrobacterales bacterium]
MTRLAEGRSTHLDRSEIAQETLRLFDEGGDPSIRQLAKVLGVTPSAIYHHFDSRAQIVQEATAIVFAEILANVYEQVGDPFEADPVEFLMATAFETRRAFCKHFRIAPYMAASPESDELSAGTLSIMANAFERLGLFGESAAEAFYSYSTYTFGNSLFAANRLAANAALEISDIEPGRIEKVRSETVPESMSRSRPETREAIDRITDLSVLDPVRDEMLFTSGLRRLLESIRAA